MVTGKHRYLNKLLYHRYSVFSGLCTCHFVFLLLFALHLTNIDSCTVRKRRTWPDVTFTFTCSTSPHVLPQSLDVKLDVPQSFASILDKYRVSSVTPSQALDLVRVDVDVEIGMHTLHS